MNLCITVAKEGPGYYVRRIRSEFDFLHMLKKHIQPFVCFVFFRSISIYFVKYINIINRKHFLRQL